MILTLTLIALMLAVLPAGLFFANLQLFKPLPLHSDSSPVPVSVLIPARNEEASIAECLKSVLSNNSTAMEVIVLDDGSTDQTCEICRVIAVDDSRVRIETAPPLLPNWCGKQHACYTLSKLASHDVLMFLDADVRVSSDAISLAANHLIESNVSLLSGFPRQTTGTATEKLLLPLIHFMLLGFLPIARMRASTSPAYGAGCGQWFLARRDPYLASGGHSAIATSLHDGITLPRAFRRAGFRTDIFDGTDTASCRMYTSALETFSGLAKNATEGLASPIAIVPWTILLFTGQIFPWMLTILAAVHHHWLILALSVLAIAASLSIRIAAAKRFRQSWLGVMFHPVGILLLLVIQWFALVRKMSGKPATWRGRTYA